MSSVFRAGGISYLRVPAEDPRRSAAFYEAVFGWTVRTDRDDPSFEDGTGHVIGHFVSDLPVAGDAGIRPYVFVENVDETLERVVVNDGEICDAAVSGRRPDRRDIPRSGRKRRRRLAESLGRHGLEVLLEHPLDARARDAAGEALGDPLALHEDERRHLVHLEPRREVGPQVDVDPPEPHALAFLAREVREQALHPAGRP